MRKTCSKETIVLAALQLVLNNMMDTFAKVLSHLQVVLLELIVIAINKLTE